MIRLTEKIETCPSCHQEAFWLGNVCPLCGYQMNNGQAAIRQQSVYSETHPQENKPDSDKKAPIIAAAIWIVVALLYIAIAKPYGYSVSRAELNSAIIMTALPALIIFFVVYGLQIVSGKTVGQKTTERFNVWAKDTQKKELTEFVDALSAMDADELGLPVAFAADFRIKLFATGVDLGDPLSVNSKFPELTSQLSREVLSLQRQERTVEAAPLIIWVHSLRALSRPELRKLGRKMWGELQRGFRYVDQAS